MKRFKNVARRTLGAGLAVAAVGLFAVSGANAQSTYDMAKEEGKLTIYSDQTIETIQALTDGFKAKYPGIDVDFFRSDSTKVMQRFETESAAGRHTADVMTTVDRLVKTLVSKGLTQEYRSPELSNYPEDLHVANGQYSNWGVSLTSFAYNTDQLSEADAPKDWEDLLDPKYKGKIGMQDPLSGGGAKMWVVTMFRELGADKWEDFMTKLAGQDIIYNSYLPIREMLISGEITIQVAAYPDYTEPVRVQGAPVNWSTPRFLGFVGLTAFVSANAPNPNSAKLFVDFMLSKEGQNIVGERKLIPALSESRPGTYARLNDSRIVPNAVETLQGREEFFEAKLKEFFGKR